MTAGVHKREEKRVSNCLKAVYEVQKLPDIVLCGSSDNSPYQVVVLNHRRRKILKVRWAEDIIAREVHAKFL